MYYVDKALLSQHLKTPKYVSYNTHKRSLEYSCCSCSSMMSSSAYTASSSGNERP